MEIWIPRSSYPGKGKDKDQGTCHESSEDTDHWSNEGEGSDAELPLALVLLQGKSKGKDKGPSLVRVGAKARPTSKGKDKGTRAEAKARPTSKGKGKGQSPTGQAWRNPTRQTKRQRTESTTEGPTDFAQIATDVRAAIFGP